MYELNGNKIDAAQLQLAADQHNMDLETFMRTFNVVEVGDEPQQDETQVAPMQENQNVKPLEHISFGEYNYDYEQEGDAETHLVKKLREKYKDLPFDFDEAGMLVDKLKVTAHSGAEQTFDLSSFWNYGDLAGQRDSSYDDFINFIEQNNDADDDVVQAFKSSGLLPINYPIVDTGKRKKAVVTGREEQEDIEVEKRVMRQATPKEMNSLVTETRRVLKDIYDNPSKYDILPSHSYDTNKIDLFMGDHREKVQNAAWNIISKNKNLPRMMSVQNPYNLVNRTYEIGMSEISIREKCGLLVYYPLATGALSGKYRNGQMPKNSRQALFKGWERHLNPLAMNAYEEYHKLAKEYNMTMAQLAQAFVNSRPFVTSNIIGATTMDQLKENIDSVNIELSDEIMKKINVIHNNNPNPSP